MSLAWHQPPGSFAPSGLALLVPLPGAYAPGCILTPLRGLTDLSCKQAKVVRHAAQFGFVSCCAIRLSCHAAYFEASSHTVHIPACHAAYFAASSHTAHIATSCTAAYFEAFSHTANLEASSHAVH